LERIYERLEAMDSATAEMRAAQILHGLGFTKKMQNKKTRDFSGGWRMRIALARALFMNPTILLLDEPTNHLGKFYGVYFILLLVGCKCGFAVKFVIEIVPFYLFTGLFTHLQTWRHVFGWRRL